MKSSQTTKDIIISWFQSSFDVNSPLPEALASLARGEAVWHLGWGLAWLAAFVSILLLFLWLINYLDKHEKFNEGENGVLAIILFVLLVLAFFCWVYQLSYAAYIFVSPHSYLTKEYLQ
jgi:glucan phosphoethanolaminetransferase (alkaline phosphatase superfamily)